jgi:hypothetical protein
MKRLIENWLTERNVFYLVLVFSISMLFTVKFYPSMDGPCHLYNSNIISQLIEGNSFALKNFFVLNNTILPNWVSYIILSAFNSFLPAWLAEKILLVIYITGISISFRLLIKQLSPDNFSLSIFIFPFANSFLFHLGFYNYCLSFVFLFLTLSYWLKYYETNTILKYLGLLVLLMLTYLSAILTFFYLGLCLGLFTVLFTVKNYDGNKKFLLIKKVIKELIILLIISLPCLIFSLLFIKSITFFPSSEHISTGGLIKWLNDVRCLIVYDYVDEEKLTEQFLHIAIAILSISFFIRFYNKRTLLNINIFRISDVFLIPVIFTLFLYFTVPNGSNAGMMSDRYCLLAYMFFIIWVSSQTLPKMASNFFVILIIIFHVVLMLKHHNGAIKDLNKDAITINNSSKYIEDNSIVLPVNMSDNWIEPHFSNYLGVDKPMIILENYEASVGWFPVKWNTQKLLRLKAGEADTFSGLSWISKVQSNQIKQIDYIFLYGNLNKVNETEWIDLKSVLNKYYKPVFVSIDNYVAIYKIKDGTE